MPELEILTIEQALAATFEPKRQNRWVIGPESGLDAFTCKAANRPNFSVAEHQIDFINDRRFIAGKLEVQTISLTLYDPIAPSAAAKIMDWVNLVAEFLSGRAGYPEIYKKDLSLKLLDGGNAVVEKWILRGCWPQSVNFGTLDYQSADPVTCELTLRYDKPELVM